MVKTTNENLQQQLGLWLEQIDAALAAPGMSKERQDLIRTFCEAFVPTDLEEDDISYFCNNLLSDEVRSFFSFCASS